MYLVFIWNIRFEFLAGNLVSVTSFVQSDQNSTLDFDVASLIELNSQNTFVKYSKDPLSMKNYP